MSKPEIDFEAVYDEKIARKIVDFIASLDLTNEVAYATVAACLAGQLATNPNPDSRALIMEETVRFMRRYIATARTLGGEYLGRH